MKQRKMLFLRKYQHKDSLYKTLKTIEIVSANYKEAYKKAIDTKRR